MVHLMIMLPIIILTYICLLCFSRPLSITILMYIFLLCFSLPQFTGQLPDLIHILEDSGFPSPTNKYIFNGKYCQIDSERNASSFTSYYLFFLSLLLYLSFSHSLSISFLSLSLSLSLTHCLSLSLSHYLPLSL